MDQVKFAEDSLYEIWSDTVCEQTISLQFFYMLSSTNFTSSTLLSISENQIFSERIKVDKFADSLKFQGKYGDSKHSKDKTKHSQEMFKVKYLSVMILK